MQRYFVTNTQINESTVTFDAEQSHHIARVMRYQTGDSVIVCDNTGTEFHVTLMSIQPGEVLGQIIAEQISHAEPRMRVTIAQALLKSDKMDWIVQKGTELGIMQFLPFTAERSVVKLKGVKANKRSERWQKIAKEAAEQSHRSRIPHVFLPTDWESVLHLIPSVDLAIIPYEREQHVSLSSLWRKQNQVDSCLIIIGPEGGFEHREIEQAREAGAHVVHLGSRILRAETAAITAIACTMWAGGEMEGGIV